ncbi:MAG: ABC transporter ATP-binding protein [Oscillibacter sp.]|nr:ABC transporter ATP-binding protein [Oscillibacter sp.]
MKPVVSMKHICKSFFGSYANHNVDFEAYPGEVHALLGENGAGKTTLMNILYGIYTPDEGSIEIDGVPVVISAPKDAITQKIGMVHQHFKLVSNLTVSQNITLGLKSKGYPFTRRSLIDKRLREISEQYGLAIDPAAKISSLSVGQQQRVEIMKLLYRDVTTLILDEPTAVLTPRETEDFFDVLKRLRSSGKAVIIITHRIPEVMEISDRVTVLMDGKKVASLMREELNEDVLSRLMIGRELGEVRRTLQQSFEGKGLSVSNLNIKENGLMQLSNVSLTIAPGEIHGIAGVAGNGQKYLAEAIVGIRKYAEGSIALNGVCLDRLDIENRKKLGIGYISDDRHRDGLIADMDLSENLLLSSACSRYVKHGWIRKKDLTAAAEETVKRFEIKARSVKLPIRYLSGGNQQKLILARELTEDVRLIIAFQPTRGLDIGATEFVHKLLNDYKAKGCCVLLISADLNEVFSISDRVSVMYSGRIAGTVNNNGNVDMTKIGLMMAGKEQQA